MTQTQKNSASSHSPLVSVLCRSMNRAELAEALVSIEMQSYPNIEIILVDASSKGLNAHKDVSLTRELIEVHSSSQLNRPAAANLALANASGELLLFLDEDDWIAPEHIANLVATLTSNPHIGVAYSSTQKAAIDGTLSDEIFNTEFSWAQLRRDNFIPIHSALFRKEFYALGCQFDEALDIFEDWDFWLQLAQKTEFVHIDEITAYYRDGGESNTATKSPMVRFESGNSISSGRALLFSKWFPLWEGQQINETLGTLDRSEQIIELERQAKEITEQLILTTADVEKLNIEKSQLNEKMQSLDKSLNDEIRSLDRKLGSLNQSFQRKSAELEEAKAHINFLNSYIQQIYKSVSWRITKPVRGIKRLLIAMGAQKVKSRLNNLKQAKTRAASNTTANSIKCSLDTPTTEQTVFSDRMTLQGWACAPSSITKVEAFVDGEIINSFSTGISRPDLAEAFPDLHGAISAGFYQELFLDELPAGEHSLEIRVVDSDGNTSSMHKPFSLEKSADLYNAWYWRNTPSRDDIVKSIPHLDSATKSLPFHVVVIDRNDDVALGTTLASLESQAWRELNVHIVCTSRDDVSTLRKYESSAFSTFNVSPNLEDALSRIGEKRDWVILTEAGERLAPNALVEYAQVAKHDGTELIYSDHDKYDNDDNHCAPAFTPQWSPEHLYASNYVGGIFALRCGKLIGASLPITTNLSWRYFLLLQLMESLNTAHRIAKVLWSSPATIAAEEIAQSEFDSVKSALLALSPQTQVTQNANGIRHVQWPLERSPKVSIIIPTMGKLSLIQPCIESLLTQTAYPNFEIIILDNGRGTYPEGIAYLREKGLTVIQCNYAFNWAKLNNVGTQHASGELYLFLNDDIEIIHESWLDEMVRLALRSTTGTVGALLYYPNKALQHAGVLLVNYGGGALHMFHKRMPSNKIYRHLHETTREVSASTGACLMVSKDKFDEVAGFDEELAVVGNDIDLCIRLMEKGYQNIWTPHARLIHHESISRKTSAPREDEQAMWTRWSKLFLAGDRYYNPNLLSEHGDFSLNASASTDNLATSAGINQDKQSSSGLKAGVNLIGYTRAEMGIGEGARSDAKALHAANEPFGIICFTSGNPSRMKDLSWQHKEVDSAPYDVTLLHINPDQALAAISELPSAYFDDHYVIGYWAWELPMIPKEWESAFTHFDEIWVPSSFVQDAVAIKSPIPVIRIPHAIEVTCDASMTRKDFGLPEESYLFFSMFDTHSLQERKNPYGSIHAFKQAFAPNDMSARLVLKVNNSNADTMSALKSFIGNYKNIILLNKVFSRVEINSLIANIDCLVSLHRSEGFGLGPAEAMALGKPILATHWSGNSDYMRPDNSVCVGYELVEIQEDYGPYKKGQIWAEPDIAQAATGMRNLVTDKELGPRLGLNAQNTIKNEFSPTVVGELMRARLAQIRSFLKNAQH